VSLPIVRPAGWWQNNFHDKLCYSYPPGQTTDHCRRWGNHHVDTELSQMYTGPHTRHWYVQWHASSAFTYGPTYPAKNNTDRNPSRADTA